MNPAAFVLAPLMIALLPAASSDGGSLRPASALVDGDEAPGLGNGPDGMAPFSAIADRMRVDRAEQVHIEQRLIIRIAPRTPSFPQRMTLPQPLPEGRFEPRYIEGKLGKCLTAASIVGMRPGSGSRLVLFMRDRTMVSAVLERACHARDFYSGFLVHSDDGRICVDRDALLSRSGASCRITRVRELVPIDE